MESNKRGFFHKRWDKLDKRRRFRIIMAGVMFLVLAAAAIFAAAALDSFLSGRSSVPEFTGLFESIGILSASDKARIIYAVLTLMLLCASAAFAIINPTPYLADTSWVTPNIKIPKPSGQGQHGTARFMTDSERRDTFDDMEYAKSAINELTDIGRLRGVKEAEIGNALIAAMEKLNPDITKDIEEGENRTVFEMANKTPPVEIVDIPLPSGEIKSIFKQAGLVIHKINTPAGEKLTCITADTHSLIIGMTRSGKTRCLVLQTAVALALAGESMVFSDPKGELWAYLAPFLKALGYNVICLDFKNPLRSDRYNFLQPIIDYLLDGKPEKAEEAVEDLVNIFTPDAKQAEPIWTNGERSVISGAILGVILDNMTKGSYRPELWNLTNVYHFIAEMCETKKDAKGKEQDPFVNKWLDKLPSGHLARSAFGAAKIAPGKTRGSFYTSALATLKLFSGANIHSMTGVSDYDPKSLGREKTALFIILPDDKSTYYRLASIIVKQHYQKLVEDADARGGRLKRRVNFILDEFGNFAKIPDFCNMLTVGGGRGLRFNLFLQDFAQLVTKYDENEAKTIRSNCETWVYLKSNDNGTNEEISKRLGKYTTTSYSVSQNAAKYTAPSTGASVQLLGRELLTPDEVALIKRPEALVISAGNRPAVTVLPDISMWTHNDLLGLGSKEHNAAVIAARAASRPERKPKPPVLWCIWERYANGQFDLQQEELENTDSRVSVFNEIPDNGMDFCSDAYTQLPNYEDEGDVY